MQPFLKLVAVPSKSSGKFNRSEADAYAHSFLKSSSNVQVTQGEFIAFMPKKETNQTGLILYPGAMVDPVAYAPIAAQLAEKGIPSVIVPMPCDMALCAPNRAGAVVRQYPQVKDWVIAGHSQGGSLAAGYGVGHPGHIKGIIMMAAFSLRPERLIRSGLKTLFLEATEDQVLPEKLYNRFTQGLDLCPHIRFFKIQGGNHRGFGSYITDEPYRIPKKKQHQIIVSQILHFIKKEI